MESTKQTVYIIDTWNEFTKDKVISKFRINGHWYAIKEVILAWGIPQLSSIEEDYDKPFFHLYETEEEAREYVRQIKRLEGARLQRK